MSDNKDGEGGSRLLQSYHTVFTNGKAGIDGVDKKEEKNRNIVIKRKEVFIKQKIEKMRAECDKLTAVDLFHYQKVADKKIVELEGTRDLSRTWLHVDMDAFYAAVETKENPLLMGKPMAVGSMSMISTANYEARKFGVRAAMPGYVARKLCPELIIVPVDFKKYTHYSELTRKVFLKYDPNFIASSLDEAYLNVTEVCKAKGISSEEIAGELRAGVFEETGLTCSAGVAPNRMLAKVCSDINKPNGHFVLRNDRIAVMAFISSLPIWKIGGIGKVTEHILRDVLGISTCEEILHKSAYLCALFSHSLIDFFLSAALGLGKTHTPEARSWNSISNERTFSATADEVSLFNNIECKWWNDTKERSNQMPGGNQMDVNKRDERIQAEGDKNNVWHHDCFHELETDTLPPTSKRPAFGEKIIEQESGSSAEMTATVSGRPTSIKRPASETARRKEWEGCNLYGDRIDKPFRGDRVPPHWRETQRVVFSSLQRFGGGGDGSLGKDRSNGRCAKRNRKKIHIDKWKHDLVDEVNKSPSPFERFGGGGSLGKDRSNGRCAKRTRNKKIHIDKWKHDLVDEVNKSPSPFERFGGGGSLGKDISNGKCGKRNRDEKIHIDKWKHDLFDEVNKCPSPSPKNTVDQIAKVEALLAS